MTSTKNAEGIGQSTGPGIYLDHAATTYPHENVIEAMQPFLERNYRNPSARYASVEATAVADARQSVADLLETSPENVVFTGGGSEANNLALKGVIDAMDGDHVITTTIEHSAIDETCDWLEEHGVDVTRIAPGSDGRVDPADVQEAIQPETTLVSVMHANNETGVIQPLEEIGAITNDFDVVFHSDTVQSAGKIPIDVDDIGLDLASLSAHKFYGPNGVGALYVRDGVELEPLIHGGGQELGLRSGTENVAGIVGMWKAADLAITDLDERRSRLDELRTSFEMLIHEKTDGKSIGNSEHRLPGYATIGFPDRSGSHIVDALADHDIAVSSGSACHSEVQAPSRVLIEMGVEVAVAMGAVRFTMGRETTMDDIEDTVRAIRTVLGNLSS